MEQPIWLGFTSTEILTAALVFITGYYAWVTQSIAKSNKLMVEKISEQIESQTRPVVSVTVGVRSKVVFYLRIANVGHSTATHLKLTADKSFHRWSEETDESNIRSLRLFREEIATFAAGEAFEIDLSQGFNINIEKNGENISPDRFDIEAAYNSGQTRYNDRFVIDLRPYMGTRGAYTVVEELNEIKKVLEKKLS